MSIIDLTRNITQDINRDQFSVVQFFADGTSERVRDHVGPKEAVHAAKHYATSVGAQIGNTCRVIIIDGGDCINFEWKYGEGITYPVLRKQA